MILERCALSFIEVFFIVAAGFSIFGIKLEIKKICRIAIIQVITIFAVRELYGLLNIPLGTHTMILAIVGVLISKFVTKIKTTYCALAYFIGTALLLMGEGILMFPLCIKMQVDPLVFLHQPIALLFFSILSQSFVIIAFVMCYLFDFKVIDLNKINGLDKKV